jgi:predicted ABC-type ATPase
LLKKLTFSKGKRGVTVFLRIFATSMIKNLYIISGCNGAGKTTASYTVLPEILECKEFVNADEIARGLSPFNATSVAIEAGRLMLQRIEELLSRQETFSIATTLATRSYVNLVRRAKAYGYRVSLLFFWLRTPELAIQRVVERVQGGGHDIPVNIIKRRYISGINNLFKLYVKEVDYWAIYDNTMRHRQKIASGRRGSDSDIFDEEQYRKIKEYVR